MQTDRDVAEMIAQFRTPPGMNWGPLADDIETVLTSRRTKTMPDATESALARKQDDHKADDPLSETLQGLEEEAARTRRKEMAEKAAQVSEALETNALIAADDEPAFEGREWHPDLRQKAREVAAYLKEQAE